MTQYGQTEERLNILSHGIGVILSIIALPLLIKKAYDYGDQAHIFSAAIYGISSIILYSASTVYHSSPDNVEFREKMETIDHASIFLLIAGSFTPFALVVLKGFYGWLMFAVAWGIAAVGVIFKLASGEKYKMISLASYILMGCSVIFFIDPIVEKLQLTALKWLGIGGVFYLTGAVLYAWKPLKLNHSVFHTLILLGTISHFIAIYFYVLPYE